MISSLDTLIIGIWFVGTLFLFIGYLFCLGYNNKKTPPTVFQIGGVLVLDCFSVFCLDEFVTYEFIDWVGFGGGDIEFDRFGEHIDSSWLSPAAFVKNFGDDFCLSCFDEQAHNSGGDNVIAAKTLCQFLAGDGFHVFVHGFCQSQLLTFLYDYTEKLFLFILSLG